MYLLQPSTIVGSPPSQMVFGMALMGRSSAHGKRQIDKRIRQSQVLRQGLNITWWMWAIVSTSHPTDYVQKWNTGFQKQGQSLSPTPKPLAKE